MAISVVGMRIRIQRKKKGAPTQSGGDFLLVQRQNSDVQEFIDSIFHVEMAFICLEKCSRGLLQCVRVHGECTEGFDAKQGGT